MNYYKVSKYINTIKKTEKSEEDHNLYEQQLYKWFNSFDEAKQFLIDREKAKILHLRKEADTIEKRLPKLKALKEKM